MVSKAVKRLAENHPYAVFICGRKIGEIDAIDNFGVTEGRPLQIQINGGTVAVLRERKFGFIINGGAPADSFVTLKAAIDSWIRLTNKQIQNRLTVQKPLLPDLKKSGHVIYTPPKKLMVYRTPASFEIIDHRPSVFVKLTGLNVIVEIMHEGHFRILLAESVEDAYTTVFDRSRKGPQFKKELIEPQDFRAFLKDSIRLV